VLVAFLVFGLARPAVSAPRLVPGFEVLAATGPKLLVLVAPLDGPARTQAGLLEHTAESAVKAQGRFALLRSADALDGRAARAREESAEKARKLDKDGRQKLDDLDAVAGAATLAEALAAWRASDLTEHFKDFTATWSSRGGAYATGDENVRARQDIERILAVAPDTVFSNAYYPPDLLKYAEGLRKTVASANGELTVRSEPVGARIWVDGVYRGVAPATIKGLANGRHFVTALLAGRSMWQSEVPLGEELVKLEPAEGAANWSRTLEKLSKDPDGPGRDTAAREVAAATGAEQVLLLVAKKSVNGNQLELTGIRIEARDGHNAAFAKKVVPMDSTEAADGFVAALLEKDAPRKEGKPLTHFDGGAGGGVHPTRRIVGLSIAGAGVLLAGTGALFGGLALGKQEEFRNTLQTDTARAQEIANTGRTFAIVCDITLITGVVAAAFGSVAGFTTLGQNWFQPREGGEPPPPEPKKDEPPAKKDEAKKDKAAEPKKDEPKKEPEPKKDEPKKDEPRKTRAQEAEERKKKEAEEKKAKEEEEKRKKEEEKKAKEDEKRKKEEEKKGGDKKKAEEEAAAKKKADDEAAARKAEEDKKKKEEEAKKKKAEEEAAAKKKAEEEAARKRKEEEAKKKAEDHDDLKNY
jgi:PEGA domain